MWGHNILLFSPVDSNNNYIFLFGGQQTDGGSMINTVFQSSGGIMCDLDGIGCSGYGTCGKDFTGCECLSKSVTGRTSIGEYCEIAK